ncbi:MULTISPECIES: hypothetical protein [unclassified Shewanella]|uniref:hypothetical protein n=1 Tax=unclassified Shewanella TaxID=196818 RepID=UPI0021DA3F96|nr:MULTISPECIES: hypothetical protein [unclassified Shewanella]EGT3626575.1 hypothetical protein [Morganella morganii]MCU8043302.1 hypothetical protein [Shewanella sp. SM68]MCU8047676.1 hypothetical protein [Shewanella sp. SM65]
MTTHPPITISSEDDAFNLLEAVRNGAIDLEGLEYKFEGWPKFSIRLQGEAYNSSITPPIMKAFLELQANIYRSYALTRYNSPNVRNLTAAERSELEIIVTVEQGSSLLGVDLQAILEKVSGDLVGKMEPKHLIVTILGIAVVWGGVSSYKSYLDNRVQIRQTESKTEEQKALIENLKFSTEQETERLKIIKEIIAENPKVANVADLADDTRAEMLKRAKDATTVEVQGVKLTGDEADELSKNARRKSEEIRLDGQYRILNVDSSNPDEFKVKLRCLSSGAEFVAKVQDRTLEGRHIEVLKNAEWQRVPVKLQINAKDLDGQIKDAVVINAQAQPVDDA